ncbi:MAG: hypothetical protein EVA65_02340 [Oceanococcus sp.]|nr:MAG: hypothetical protein EVA65_02340 [Oceanococcus sp.]
MSQKEGQRNLALFENWAATMTDEAYKQIVYAPTGTLNKSEIVKGSTVSLNALKKNQQIKTALERIEDGLRERGILPPLAKTGSGASPKSPRRHDPKANASLKADQRASALEKELVALRAENAQLKASLSRYGELSEVIGELGLIPR